jgi:2,4-dienoyl-CoA reductase-like NADH-dependent reductase (Old Yellow Enzyme family)
MDSLSHLFSPFTVGSLTLKNRVVMAPMATNMGAKGGVPSPEMLTYYGERAQGGVGLLIIEAAVATYQPGLPDVRIGVWSDEQIGPMGELAAIIAKGGAVPAIQIVDLNLRHTGRAPADLTVDEIHGIQAGVVAAVKRAKAAGFAAVDVHGAHSTTFSDFLSRRANRRTDAYGGNDAGRARIVTEVVAAARAEVGPDYPLFCRINADEYIVNGNTLKHSVPIARLLIESGIDLIDVTSGCRPEDGGRLGYSQLRGRPAAWLPDAPNLYLAAEIKRATGRPVIAVGKMGTPAVAEGALASGACDLVALGRPLLAEPNWVRKVQTGRQRALKRCTSCDRCMELFLEKQPLRCVTFDGA